MKTLFVIAAMCMGLPNAFAQIAETSDQIIEQEIGPMSNDDVKTLMSEIYAAPFGGGMGGGHNGGGHGGPGGPGGGHGGPGNGGGHGGPGGGHGGPGNGGGHGGPGGGHGGPGNGGGHGGPGGGHDRSVTCFAKDFRGNMYRAEGWRWNWQEVQRRAVDKCERWSRVRCRALGCR